MAGVKIYELARELGMPSKDLAAWAKGRGFPVKTHMSSVDEESAEKIRQDLKQEKPSKPAGAAAKKRTAAKEKPETSKTKAKPKQEIKQATKFPEAKTKQTAASNGAKKAKGAPRKTSPPKKTESGDQSAAAAIEELEALERELQRQVTVEEKKSREKPPAAPKATPKEPVARDEDHSKSQTVESPPVTPKPQKEETETPAEKTQGKSIVAGEEEKTLRIPEAITVKDLADLMGATTADLLMKMMGMGMVANVNTLLDGEQASELALEFGFLSEVVEEGADGDSLDADEEEREEDLLPRPPVVTVMGHVDHGKTSLLDAIRKTNVIATEAGSITQHIGAYHVTLDKGTVVFLDTPGHEAFTSMRARGAKVTDVVVLVVAANDGVMPQTREAIAHARVAGVPIVVAVNKIDLPNANPDKVRNELGELGLIPEKWGGDTIFVDISAKQGLHINDLLEMLLLQAEIMELKANPNRRAKGVVLEAELDKGRGPVARVLVQQGTLKLSDAFVVGAHYGRVRALISDVGRKIESAGPSMPVEVLGLSGVPQAGDVLTVLDDERRARQIATQRMQRQRQEQRTAATRVTLEDLYQNIKEGAIKELAIVLKADAQGSIEALKDAFGKLGTDEVRVQVIHSSVGGITESDVMLASASNAIIIGFHVRPTPQALTVAQREEVDIRLYNIIYNAITEVTSALSGLLEPTIKEVTLGRAEVREVFQIPRVGTVAGCYVSDGTVKRNGLARVIRDNIVIYEGKIGSLRRFKDDVAEVNNGYECGIGIEKFQDIKLGDIIEPYVLEEVQRTL